MKTILERAIVELDNVGFGYNSDPVLDHVTLCIRDHDFMAVIGPNGGGKSTLLKLILGLIIPTQGRVKVLGGEPDKNSRIIGYVPQNVNVNDRFPITVMDVVLMGTLPRKTASKDKAKIQEKALDILAQLHMAQFANRKIGEMSGGQKQRVFIARALMTQPRLLLLDEPTASIDTRGQTEFYELLKRLNKDIAIVVVGHDLFVIANYVKSVACVNKRLHYHSQEEITGNLLETMYSCSVEDFCRVQTLTHSLSPAQMKTTEKG